MEATVTGFSREVSEYIPYLLMLKLLAAHTVHNARQDMVGTPSTSEAQKRTERSEPVYIISPQKPKYSRRSLCGWRNESGHSQECRRNHFTRP